MTHSKTASHVPASTIALADAHTQAVQSWLSTRAPLAARFDGLGVSAGTTGLQGTFLNLALGFNYPSDASEEAIDADILALKMFFAKRDLSWEWWIGPSARPPGVVAERMERHGLAFDPPLLPAMVCPLPHTQSPAINPDAQVWQASNRQDLEAASLIRRIAFRGAELGYFAAMGDDWLRGDPARLYLARMGGGGPPVAIGALVMGAGTPGVYMMATLPEWRGRGLGKAILDRILSEASAEGHERIALTAGKKGYPLYRQFGFERIFDYTIYSPIQER